MRKFFKEKALFAVIFFALGMGSLWSAQWLKSHGIFKFAKDSKNEFLKEDGLNDFFKDDFEESFFKKPSFPSALKTLEIKDPIQVEEKEDEKFFYYVIQLNGVDQNKLNIKVENGQIDLSGTIEKKSENANTQSVYQSNFSRSFPAPAQTDANRVEILNEKDKVILKFPKV